MVDLLKTSLVLIVIIVVLRRKVSVVAGTRGNRALRGMFRADAQVDYYDGENTEG